MDDKEAIGILKHLQDKHPLADEEKEAVRTAIGILAWSTLIKGRMESMKRARDKRLKENADD